jgi:hypothetical protein
MQEVGIYLFEKLKLLAESFDSYAFAVDEMTSVQLMTFVRSEVFTALMLRILVFWDVTLCSYTAYIPKGQNH